MEMACQMALIGEAEPVCNRGKVFASIDEIVRVGDSHLLEERVGR